MLFTITKRQTNDLNGFEEWIILGSVKSRMYYYYLLGVI